MSGVELATAYVNIIPTTHEVAPKLRQSLGQGEAIATRSGKTAGKNYAASFGGVLKGTLGAIGIAEGASAAIGFLKDSNAEAREAQKIGAQTAAVIKSTGGIAGITAKQVSSYASAISKYAGVDDDEIAQAENRLLTFSNVRGKVFKTAIKDAVDMGTALKTGPTDAVNQLGKALNDPATGYTRLKRSGVDFSATQIAQIKNYEKQGHLAKAQGIILSELSREYGGSAAAQATASDKQRAAIKNLQESIGTKLLPVEDKAFRATTKFVNGMLDGTGAGGEFAGALHTVYADGKAVVGVIDGLPGPVKKYGAELAITAAVMKKFQLTSAISSVSTFRSGLADTGTRAATTSKALGGLRSTAVQVAGAAGMLLLYDSTRKADKGLGTLEGAAGGALAGLSAGPWGSALSAVGGGLLGLYSSTKRSGDQFKRSSSQADIYAASLDHVSGAATKASRAQILGDLQKNGTLAAGLKVGLTRRTLVDAALGKPGDIQAVRAALKALNVQADHLKQGQQDNRPALGTRAMVANAVVAQDLAKKLDLTQTQTKALTSLVGQQADSYARDARNTRLDTAAKLTHKQLLTTFPKSLVTKIETPGFKESHAQVTALGKAYHLQPKKLVTLARLNNWDLSLAHAKALAAQYDKTAKTRITHLNADSKAGRAVAGGFDKFVHHLFGDPVKQKLTATGDKPQAESWKKYYKDLFGTTITQHVKIAGAKASGSATARANGGRALVGRTYLVGERRPELFVPDQNGTIVPRVPSMASMSAIPSAPTAIGGKQRITIQIGQYEFEGMMHGLIDDRVHANARLHGWG